MRPSMPNLFPVRALTYLTWAFQDRRSSRTTPRYLNSVTRFMVCPSIVITKLSTLDSFMPVPNRTHSVLVLCKKRLFNLSQLLMMSKSLQNTCKILVVPLPVLRFLVHHFSLKWTVGTGLSVSALKESQSNLRRPETNFQ